MTRTRPLNKYGRQKLKQVAPPTLKKNEVIQLNTNIC